MNSIITQVFMMNFLLTGLSTQVSEITSSSLPMTSDTISPLQVANEYISSHLSEWGLSQSDIADMKISDMYTDQRSGITRIYFQQHYGSIPVHNAIMNLNITKEGDVFFSASRFVQDLKEKVNTTEPLLQPGEAVTKLATHFGLTTSPFRMKEWKNDSLLIFEKNDIAREDITAALTYHVDKGNVLLSWDIFLTPKNTHDSWSARVDAITGKVLKKDNWTLYCMVDHESFMREDDGCHDHIHPAETEKKTILPVKPLISPPTGPAYNVWPAPYESPDHGPRTIVTNPADTIASPFGWHDINGQPGHEYTITRGNNVFAYQDRDNSGTSSGDEPDGGTNLHFDFPFDPSWEPEQYQEASVVNLFYWINYLHDFSYRFGFDEAAGNFQRNNYGRGGIGQDFIWAIAQAGATTDTLHNNAEYHHRNEGASPSIYMYDFIGLDKYLIANEPASVVGKFKTNLPSAGWGTGAYLTDIPISGEVVLVNDGVEEPSTSDGCQDIINASALEGKIAMIDRGSCQFSYKALLAQNAGAIGVIFCNTLDNKIFSLAAGPDAININIPVVLITLKDSKILRKYAGKGLKVTLVNPGQNGPARRVSDFQNSMIGHEFGHGISIRLAGGPDKICLDNEEQMGEGWSDYFGLVTTVLPGDTGARKRGMGTYVNQQSVTDIGTRRYPYSTDMNLSPLTYGDVAGNQQKHDLGEVWANMLWDMYWALSDKYGWSANPYDESSGNYKAVRLVMDGLKNMACDPGFVDGRDAIIAADEVLNNGENFCLLWEVFARRGLGYSADQGSPYDAGDQVEAFDLPPVCTGKILIEKSVTEFIQAGEDIQVTINVSNYKNETVSNVLVTDIIPEGTTYKSNSSNYTAIEQGSALLFDLGDMNFKEENTITYTLQTSPDASSELIFLDDVPDENNTNWLFHSFGSTATNIWSITDSLSAYSGEFSWISKEITDKSQQAMMLNPDAYTFHVEGSHPTLRFYHRYNTKAGTNGGVVDIREVGTSDWKEVSQNMLRNGYKGTLDYRTFIAADIKAFSGNSGDQFKATYVDLNQWAGKDIQIRFRFGTFTNTNNGIGWLIDDIEFMNLLAYNEDVCVATDQGDFECATAPESGTIVDSKEETVSAEHPSLPRTVRIYPNPATDVITVALSTDQMRETMITLMTMEGKLLFTETIDVFGNDYLNINTTSLAAGAYIVKVNSAESQYAQLVLIQ